MHHATNFGHREISNTPNMPLSIPYNVRFKTVASSFQRFRTLYQRNEKRIDHLIVTTHVLEQLVHTHLTLLDRICLDQQSLSVITLAKYTRR